MSQLHPFIKCTSPIAIHRGNSVFLYPCRKCECCQVSRQKSLATQLALEESLKLNSVPYIRKGLYIYRN